MELGLARLSIGRRFALALLAQNYARMRRIEEALQMLNDALAPQRTGDLVDQPEMLRLKGEVLLIADGSARVQAESCFRTALQLARAQEAKWWELRSSVSLARLLRDTNRRNEAHTILAEIYDWFTEGFELPDLKDARALLEELGS